MKLNTKLLTTYLAVAIIPLLITGGIAFFVATSAFQDIEKEGGEGLSNGSFEKINLGQQLKRSQLEGFFNEREGDLEVLTETVANLKANAQDKLAAITHIKKKLLADYLNNAISLMDVFAKSEDVKLLYKALIAYHDATFTKPDGAYDVSTDEYKTIWKTLGKRTTQFQKESGFYDVFVICAKHGHVMYTAAKEGDLGCNLKHGIGKGTGLAELHAKVTKTGESAIVDMAPYAPSNGAPSMFAGAPIRNDDGELVGIMAVQLSIDEISAVMQERSGLGRTGETYLVGSDRLMRSNSYLDPKNHSVAASFANPKKGAVHTEATEDVFDNDNSDTKLIQDYNDNLVLSSYEPFKIKDITWAIIAEIDAFEALSPLLAGGDYKNDKDYYLRKYTDLYGYYDLFLIDKNGYCYYSAYRENDFATNLVSGKFASSGLGELTREVIKTKKYGINDFAPYEPSDNKQAGFIAKPILDKFGKVETVVALQLSTDAINKVVQQRTGLGETGESYLVGRVNGKTYLRSDRVIKEGNNIGKEKSGKYIDLGLSGKTGHDIKTGSSGTKELISYAPVGIKGLDWTIQTSMARDEALASVDRMNTIAANSNNTLVTSLIIVLVVVGVLIAIIALIIAKSVSRPISVAAESLTAASSQVASASGQVSASSQELAAGSSEQAASLEETSATLEEMAAGIGQNADNVKQANTLAGSANSQADSGENEAKEISVKVMEELATLNKAIEAIRQSTDSTAKVVDVIDDVAFQTNLLALNAAVEAARAGDAGMGFAVVADEVRNLAQRSAEEVKNTAALIEEAQKNTTQVEKVSAGIADYLKTATNNLVENFHNVVESTGEVSVLMNDVTMATSEQVSGIDQVNQAVAAMDQVTQSNAATAEESSAASEELSAQALELSNIVSELQAMVDGRNSGGQPQRNLHIVQQPQRRQSTIVPERQATTIESKKTQNLLPLTDDEMRNSSDDFSKF